MKIVVIKFRLGILLLTLFGLPNPAFADAHASSRSETEFHSFSDRLKLEIVGDFPHIDCKRVGIAPANISLWNTGKKQHLALILDPGHDDTSKSRRNRSYRPQWKKHYPYLHEGRLAMATSIIVKEVLQRCYGTQDFAIELTRYPGEAMFNEYYGSINIGSVGGKVNHCSAGSSCKGKDAKYRRNQAKHLVSRMPAKFNHKVLVSLHYNTGSDDNFLLKYIDGFGIYYSGDASRAEQIHSALSDTFIPYFRDIASKFPKKVLPAGSSSPIEVAKQYNQFLERSKYEEREYSVLKGFKGDAYLIENGHMDGIMLLHKPLDYKTFQLNLVRLDNKGRVLSKERIDHTYGTNSYLVHAAVGVVRGLLNSYSQN